jgi:hypothetical protein
VTRIAWPTIKADFGTIPAPLRFPFRARMMVAAWRLKFTTRKQIPIAMIRPDMIDRRCHDRAAGCSAHFTQQMLDQPEPSAVA